MKIHLYKFRSVVAVCVSGCGVCTECRAACHTLSGTQYTHHNLKHMLPQHCETYEDVFSLINSTNFNFSQAQYKLPEYGPGGPKHVGANVGHFNVNFNNLCV